MPSLKEIRVRIGSVKSTVKITKAMQMVAASKLRKEKLAKEASHDYVTKLEETFRLLASSIEPTDAPWFISFDAGDTKKQSRTNIPEKGNDVLLLVFSSERGLCGGFNANIAKFTLIRIRELQSQGKKVKIVTIGRKACDILKRQYSSLIIDDFGIGSVKSVEDSMAVAEAVCNRLLNLAKDFSSCCLVYSKFKSVISQQPVEEEILPVRIAPSTVDSGFIFDFEPSPIKILEQNLYVRCKSLIFQAMRESATSEQGSRMMAMDGATRNAGEMIDKLVLDYNRQRQTNITRELIEIISGVNAI